MTTHSPGTQLTNDAKIKGPWSRDEASAYLSEARVPIRLSCNGASGYPVIASLWFTPRAGGLWCATQRSSSVVSLLREDQHCAFEIAEESDGYRGLRGQGRVNVHDDLGLEILEALLERYEVDARSQFGRWLLARAENETALEIVPKRLYSWDYRVRMASATRRVAPLPIA